MRALEGRNQPITRIWDRDFNLIWSGVGLPEVVLGDLTVTVDHADGKPRAGGRILRVEVRGV